MEYLVSIYFRFCSTLQSLVKFKKEEKVWHDPLIHRTASQIKLRKWSLMSLINRAIYISQSGDHILLKYNAGTVNRLAPM